MGLDEIMAVTFGAALAAAGVVEALRALWAGWGWPLPARGGRYLWRPVSVLVGGLAGLALSGWPWGVAAGLGAGLLTTAVVAAAKARLGGGE